MKLKSAKYTLLAIIALFVFFFSNDFGIIDIEKMAIITAVAIDGDESGQYEITAQIAVPEATDNNTENKKAHVSGKGATIGAALKDIGDISGWFPNLSFCNLIILGNAFSEGNIMRVLDYFSRTLRVQESAVVALAENTAKEVLTTSSPFDSISSFAIQKIILKNPGFDNDIANNDIKTFSTGYYSESRSSFLPIIKIVKEDLSGNGQSSSGGQNAQSGQSQPSESQGGEALFDVKTTALFKDGVKVGEMPPRLTLAFNMLTQPFKGTTIEIDGVKKGLTQNDVLLTCFRCSPKIHLKADENELMVKIDLSLFCKISDQSSVGEDDEYHKNNLLPPEVIEKAESDITQDILDLIELEKQTGCDFLNLKQKLYRYNYKQYSRYKDNYLSTMKVSVSVNVSGQK